MELLGQSADMAIRCRSQIRDAVFCMNARISPITSGSIQFIFWGVSGHLPDMNEEQVKRAVGRQIRELRKGAGFTLEGLAEAAEVDATHLSAIERGRHNASLLLLWRLSEALEVQLSTLVDLEEAETRTQLLKRASKRIKNLDDRELRQMLRLMDEVRR